MHRRRFRALGVATAAGCAGRLPSSGDDARGPRTPHMEAGDGVGHEGGESPWR